MIYALRMSATYSLNLERDCPAGVGKQEDKQPRSRRYGLRGCDDLWIGDYGASRPVGYAADHTGAGRTVGRQLRQKLLFLVSRD